METRQELPQVSHLTHAELLELKAATTDQRVWYAVSRELAARAEHGGGQRYRAGGGCTCRAYAGTHHRQRYCHR